MLKLTKCPGHSVSRTRTYLSQVGHCAEYMWTFSQSKGCSGQQGFTLDQESMQLHGQRPEMRGHHEITVWFIHVKKKKKKRDLAKDNPQTLLWAVSYQYASFCAVIICFLVETKHFIHEAAKNNLCELSWESGLLIRLAVIAVEFFKCIFWVILYF